MKSRLLLYIFCCYSVPSLYAIEINDKELATLLQTVPVHEISLIYNVIYQSWKRSVTTCATQYACIEGLAAYWKTWHTYSCQRLDPSRVIVINPMHTQNILHHAHMLQEQFISVNKRYSELIDYALYPSIRWHPYTEAFIEHIRSTARTVVRNVISTHVHNLKVNIDRIFSSQERSTTALSNTRHIFSTLSNYIALNSFSALDETLLEQSNTFFQLFIRSQELINQMWHIIESARAEYYKQLYIKFYTAMKQAHISDAAFQYLYLSSEEHVLEPTILPSPANMA